MRDDRPLEQRAGTDLPRVDEAGSRTDLSRRLGSLPDGHPSSRYEADGTPRETGVQLRDLDTSSEDDDTRAPDRLPPFTDAEWSEHLTEIRALLVEAKRAGLSTLVQYAIDKDGEAWTAGRREIHGAVIDSLYAQSAAVPCDHKAIIAGGLAGAGKTTVLADHAGIDRSQYLTINPDDIKVEMAKRGLVPKVEGLSPMEAADLVHEESSHIAMQLAIRAQADGKNIIWDITMSKRESVERRIDDLRDSGYSSVSGIFVDIPVEVSASRTDARHREGQDKFRTGDGLGGRYVPPEVSAGQADAQWGSRNRRAFEELKSRFDEWTRFDNGVDDRDPVLVAVGSRDPEERIS
jgi:predicted kinase